MTHYDPIFQNVAFSYFDKHQEFQELAGLVGYSKFFVTGATGVFGRWFLEYFNWVHIRSLGQPAVTVLSRNQHQYHFEFLDTVLGDIKDFVLPQTSFEYLIHLAAPSAKDTFRGMPDADKVEQLYFGTKRVLEFAQTLVQRRSLIASSGAIYGGFPPDYSLPISETNRTAPLTSEDRTGLALGKRLSEFLCHDAVRNNVCDLSIARLFSFVGPLLPVDTHYAIGNFVAKAVRGEDIIINGDGMPVRSYMFLGDMVYWLLTILFKGQSGGDYNVGSSSNLTILELAQRIQNVINSDTKISVLGKSNDSPGNPVNYFYIPNTGKASRALGLRELTTLDEGLAVYAEYLRSSLRLV